MKTEMIRIAVAGLFSLFLIMTSGCEDDIVVENTITEEILGTWETGNVTLDGFDVTSPSYEEFAILFRPDGSYFTVDGDPIFTSAGGFWRVVSGENNFIELGGITTSYSVNSGDGTLTLSFTANGNTIGVNARESGLSGNYVFTLNSTDRNIEE